MRKPFILLLLLILVMVMSSTVLAAKYTDTVNMSSGSLGGNWFPMMTALGELILKPAGINYTNGPGGGIESVIALHQRQVELGLTQALSLDWAKDGKAPFDKIINDVQALVNLYPDALHIVVGKDTDIFSIKDLKGKRVAVNLAGQTAAVVFKDLLNIYGIEEDEVKIRRGSPGEGQALYNDGLVDAWAYTSPLPSPQVLLMLSSRDSRIIPVTDEEIEALGAGYSKVNIEPEIYPQLDKTVQSAGLPVVIITHEDLSVDLAYKLTKIICTNFQEMWPVWSCLNGIEAKDLANIPKGTPIHAGALKYFKEVGLMK